MTECNHLKGYYEGFEAKNLGILEINDEVILSVDEIEYGFKIFKHFPAQISGPFAAFVEEDVNNTWSYSNENLNQFNLITTQAFWIHKKYLNLMKPRFKLLVIH